MCKVTFRSTSRDAGAKIPIVPCSWRTTVYVIGEEPMILSAYGIVYFPVVIGGVLLLNSFCLDGIIYSTNSRPFELFDLIS